MLSGHGDRASIAAGDKDAFAERARESKNDRSVVADGRADRLTRHWR